MIKNKYSQYDKIFICLRNNTPKRLSNGERLEADQQKSKSKCLYKNGEPLYNFTYSNNFKIWNKFKKCLDVKDKKIFIVKSLTQNNKFTKPRKRLVDNLLKLAQTKNYQKIYIMIY
jgi:hypothetical protein